VDEGDPVPISALQHWRYCPRQCGLIHLEQAFEENVHTLRGRAVHSAVDTPGIFQRALVTSSSAWLEAMRKGYRREDAKSLGAEI
jgi:hypothetical protein